MQRIVMTMLMGVMGIAAVLPSLGDTGPLPTTAPAKIDAKAVQERISGKMVGVGVGLQKADDGVKITRVIANSPAERGGLNVGEVIVSVDGQSLAGLPVKEAVDRIKGEEGSKVSLDVRNSKGRPRRIELTRESFSFSPVEGRIVEEGIGLVKIQYFSKLTPEEFRQRVKELQAKGARGLILDLRTCAGGTATSARDVAEALLPKRKLLWIVRPRKGKRQRVVTRKPCDIELPMVVLIGKNTGGAPEILASALKENGRAVLIGQTTSGAACLKSLVKCPDGSNELVVVGKLLARPRVLITGQGVSPDIKLPEDASEKTVLDTAVKKLSEVNSNSKPPQVKE